MHFSVLWGDGDYENTMKWYVLLFKYAGEWHMDVSIRDEGLDETPEGLNTWLREATRFAVERLNLRKPGCDIIDESQAFELTCYEETQTETGKVRLDSVPVAALADIHLID